MNHQERNDCINRHFQEIMSLSRSKGKEYSNSDVDANLNFKQTGDALGLTPKQVLWVYLDKHLRAIASYLRTEKVYSEPIEGRIHDAILYLFLLITLIEETPCQPQKNSSKKESLKKPENSSEKKPKPSKK